MTTVTLLERCFFWEGQFNIILLSSTTTSDKLLYSSILIYHMLLVNNSYLLLFIDYWCLVNNFCLLLFIVNWCKQSIRRYNWHWLSVAFINRGSVLLEEETGVLRENHWSASSHWQILSHNVVSSTLHHERDSNSQLKWW